MAYANVPFQERLKRINKNHKRLVRGAVTDIRPDGLMVIRPKRRVGRFFWKPAAGIIVGFFFFKSFLLAGLGPVTYASRVESLRQGTQLEAGAAWVMEIDPLSTYIADIMVPYIPRVN